MESSRSKRRRLISVSSYASPRRRPDLPAIFESLNDDTLTTVLEFVGDKSYKSFGGTNKRCKEVYITSGMMKETFVYGYAPLSVIQNRVERVEQTDYWLRGTARGVTLSKGVVFFNRKDVLEWVLGQRKDLLREICVLAAEEERFDILNEILDNIDEKKAIFFGLDEYETCGGKLDVIKWFEKKGLSIDKENCAYGAARYGKLDILQWLQEEKSFVLNEGQLYEYAIRDGHLHVMKWLREQGCPWCENTFYHAVSKGNLNILQWLHNEGCPWPEDKYRVCEEHLKPETLDWCRVNGYHNRIVFRND